MVIFTLNSLIIPFLEKGNFITMRPQSPLVAKYVAYYYFHSSNDENFSNKFYFYPNYKHALTVYVNSDITFTDNGSVVKPADTEKCTTLYSVNTHQSFRVALSGPFSKIGVVFNPLGINHFIKEPLSGIFKPSFDKFDYFGPAWQQTIKQVFTEPAQEIKTTLLDDFFTTAFCGFDAPVIKTAVSEILNSNGAVRVEELSDLTGVNRKTLLRLFKKHLCASIEEYKKMVMFRNALNYAQQAGEDASLTDVALYSLYYDQAHYIKHFKSVTKQSPKGLLSRLTQLGNQEVYWNFED